MAVADETCCVGPVSYLWRHANEKSVHRQRNHARLDVFLSEIPCVDFDVKAASFYGRVRAALERRGNLIGPYDLQIAAHALALGLVLVSDNTREFRRVRGLRVEDGHIGNLPQGHRELLFYKRLQR